MAVSMHSVSPAVTRTPFGMRSSAAPPVAGGGARGLAGKPATFAGMALVFAFIVGLVLPVEASFFVGPMRLSPYRVVLLIVLFPCLFRFFTGQAGKLTLFDAFIIVQALWAWVALTVNHGIGIAWEPAGIYIVESVVPYLLARCYIRTAEDFQAFARFVLVIVIVLVPIAAYESLTGNILRPAELVPAPRLGLHRAFGPFEHPILFGVFCSSMLGIAFFAFKGESSAFARLVRCSAIALATFFSLSAGPFVAFVAQSGLIAWNHVLHGVRRRWVLLAGCAIAGWAVVAALSNRTPVEVFITYFTFNVGNAWNRIHIWHYGTAEVARNPIFGIGTDEWERAYWMSPSMDNFWLLEAVRYGLPTLILLVAAIAMLCLRMGRRGDLDERTANCRMGWMVTIVGLIFAGSTVHFWNALFVFFFFLLGSGVWILRAPAARPVAETTAPAQARPGPGALARPRPAPHRASPA